MTVSIQVSDLVVVVVMVTFLQGFLDREGGEGGLTRRAYGGVEDLKLR